MKKSMEILERRVASSVIIIFTTFFVSLCVFNGFCFILEFWSSVFRRVNFNAMLAKVNFMIYIFINMPSVLKL